MKQKILTIAATLGILLGLSAVAAAQTRNRIEANIRFDFIVGNKELKAGDYSVTRISQNTVSVRSADGKTSVIVLAPTSLQQRRDGSHERLVFKQFGSTYLLTEVWTDRDADGRGLDTMKSEQRLANANGAKPQTVEVLAKGN